MCVMSAVTDYYQNKWVTPIPGINTPGTPVPMPAYDNLTDTWTTFAPYIPPPEYKPTEAVYVLTKEQWDEYQDLKRIAQEYDDRTGQPHCEKPDISAWEAVVESVLIKRGLLAKPSQD